jgi:hypothetical protein
MTFASAPARFARHYVLLAAAALALAGCASGPGAPQSSLDTPTAAEQTYAAIHVPSREELTGAGPDALLTLLGEPALRRKETGVEMWQYPSMDCVLYVVLYEDAGSYKVAELMTHGGQPGAAEGTEIEFKRCVEAAIRESQARAGA